jgi:hypothetical protein
MTDDAVQQAIKEAVSFLVSRGIVFDAGLSDSEILAVQERYSFQLCRLGEPHL